MNTININENLPEKPLDNSISLVYLAGHVPEESNVQGLENKVRRYMEQLMDNDSQFVDYIGNLLETNDDFDAVILLEDIEFTQLQWDSFYTLQQEGKTIIEAYLKTLKGIVPQLSNLSESQILTIIQQRQSYRVNKLALLEQLHLTYPGRVHIHFEGVPNVEFGEKLVMPALPKLYEEALNSIPQDYNQAAEILWNRIASFVEFNQEREKAIVDRMEAVSRKTQVSKQIRIAWFGDGHVGLYKIFRDQKQTNAAYITEANFMNRNNHIYDPFTVAVRFIEDASNKSYQTNASRAQDLLAQFLIERKLSLNPTIDLNKTSEITWNILAALELKNFIDKVKTNGFEDAYKEIVEPMIKEG